MRSEAFLESASACVSETKKDQPYSAIREWSFAAAHGTMGAERRELRGMYFEYGETERAYLRKRDKRLCAVIDRIGHVDRAVDPDLFSSVVHPIIGQQISTKAPAIIWQRMQDALGAVNAEAVLALSLIHI